jgi:hypothetical protein
VPGSPLIVVVAIGDIATAGRVESGRARRSRPATFEAYQPHWSVVVAGQMNRRLAAIVNDDNLEVATALPSD